MDFEELQSGGAHEENRSVRETGDVLHQVEKGRLGPMDVV
jgi:hypothetical protein